MLRLIPKLLAALVAIALLLIGVIAVSLPRLVNREEFRVALHGRAAEALGTPVEWTSIEAGLVPLRLTVHEPVLLAEASKREDARLRAESLELHLSALAMMDRRLQVDSLIVHGLELVVTRRADGFVLPIEKADAAAGPDADAAPSPFGPSDDPREAGAGVPPEEGSEGEFELAVRRILIEESRLIIHDRMLPRPIEWHFEDLRLEAKGDSIEEPLAIEFSSRLVKEAREIGALTTTGEISFTGVYDLEVGLEEVLLAELQAYVADATLAGTLSGQVSIEGASDVVSKVETDLRVEDMAVKTFGLDLMGRLDLEARQTRGDPIEFEAGLDLGLGGKAVIAGSMSLDGAVDAGVFLTSLELEPYAQLAGDHVAISGRASGRVDLEASAGRGLSHLTTDLNIVDARYADATVDVGGALDLVLDLEGLAEDDPVRFDVAMALDGGGRVDAEGVATLAGAIDAKVILGEIDLSRVAPWVPEGTEIGGRLTGDAEFRVTAEQRVERLAARMRIDSARIARDRVGASGAFDLEIGLQPEGSIELDAGLILEDGSRISVEGTSTIDGIVDLEAELASFDLAILRSFLPDPEMQLVGWVSGSGRFIGDVSAPEFLSLDVGVDKGFIQTTDYALEGPFLVAAKVKEPFSRPRGRVDLDLTAARVGVLDQFTKRAGMRAEMTTRFVPEESGEIVFESQLKLRNIEEILLQGALGETTSIAVTTTDFNLKGWSEVLPVLAEYEADGVIAFDGVGVELIDGVATRFGGRISLRGVGLSVPDAGRVRLRGSILGEGTRIRTKGLKAHLAGATIGIEGTVEDPIGEGRFDLAIQTIGEAEVNDLLTELAASGGTVFGLLDLKGKVHGIWGTGESLTDSLAGELRFSIGERGGGELRGVSLLQAILDQIPLLGGAARLSRPFRGGRSVGDYFVQRFDVIEGDFELGRGKVEARSLRLAYPGYEARLSGPMQLRNLQIDMSGEVLLKGDLVSALGGLAGAEIEGRKPIRIPLARVTNTLDDPKVVMTKETLAAVPKLLLQATGIDTITLGIGKGVGKVLDRVLGSGK
ncbi:MAG: DUF748 domain-containing protein [bacterium]|nr:hypothetical protein [Deltaproteobacteria bacterium]MCP4904607.1 DUF748 domain-containing protein [bacterium]